MKRNLELVNSADLFRYVVRFREEYPGRDPYALQVLGELHYQTIKGIYECAGRMRETTTEQVEVSGASFQPAEPHEIVPKVVDLLERARNWRQEQGCLPNDNGKDQEDIEHLLRRSYFAGQCFYDMLLIHPFNGGNDRVARAFLHLMLYDMDVLRRGAYFDALRAADHGNLTPLYQYSGRAAMDSICQSYFETLRQGPSWVYIEPRLKRDERRFFDRTHRDRFPDSSYRTRFAALAAKLKQLLPRLRQASGPHILPPA